MVLWALDVPGRLEGLATQSGEGEGALEGLDPLGLFGLLAEGSLGQLAQLARLMLQNNPAHVRRGRCVVGSRTVAKCVTNAS